MNFDVAASRRRCLVYRRRIPDISRQVMADTHGLDLDTIARKVGLR